MSYSMPAIGSIDTIALPPSGQGVSTDTFKKAFEIAEATAGLRARVGNPEMNNADNVVGQWAQNVKKDDPSRGGGRG